MVIRNCILIKTAVIYLNISNRNYNLMFAIIRFIYLLNIVLRNFTPSSSSQCNQTVESIPKRIAIGAHQTYNVLGEISLHHPNSSNAFLPAEGGGGFADNFKNPRLSTRDKTYWINLSDQKFQDIERGRKVCKNPCKWQATTMIITVHNIYWYYFNVTFSDVLFLFNTSIYSIMSEKRANRYDL